MNITPVVTLDGPSGSGKGTMAQLLAQRLGWHYLDSGALYRLLGHWAREQGVALTDHPELARLARQLPVTFSQGQAMLNGRSVGDAIRTEEAGNLASQVAAIPEIRAALLEWQRACAVPPGLVADGRDMGTVVFPHAPLKVFLTASPEERANRRYKQLKEKGMNVIFSELVETIRERDARDIHRAAAPLVPAADALVLDCSALSITEVLSQLIVWVQERLEIRLPESGNDRG